jgi:hypothetical protein
MAEYILDIAKPLIGSFVGASLDFLSNLYFQKKERERKNKAAGHLALTIVLRQYNDFLMVKNGFTEERQERLVYLPNAPIWLLSRPIHFYFSDSLKFNYESLTFLLETKNSDLFLKLALIEKQYYDLAKLTSLFNTYSERIQEKLSGRGNDNEQEFSLGLALKCLEDDHDLKGKVSSLLSALNKHFEQDEKGYLELIDMLNEILKRFE